MLLQSCDAPHSNPFDPHSEAYRQPEAPTAIVDLVASAVTSTSAVLSWTAPVRAVEYLLYTGQTTWDGKSREVAVLYTGEMPGVKPPGTTQSITITLSGSEAGNWSLFSRSADGLFSTGSNVVRITPPPHDRIGVIQARTYSIFQSSWTPPDLVELSLEAAISDSDGVDSVWADCNLGNLGELLLTRDGVTWSSRIVERLVPTGILERLIGHPISIHYIDNQGNAAESTPIFLTRIIYTPPLIESPTDGVDTHYPRLTWFPYNAEFLFTYGVDIVFVSVPSYVQTPIYREYGIAADSTGHTVTDSLAAWEGFYIWTLCVEDEFGDQAFSSVYRFTIENGE